MRWLTGTVFIALAGFVLVDAPAGLPAVAEAAGQTSKASATEASAAKASADKGMSAALLVKMSRNSANFVEKNIPDDFAVRPKGKERNVQWKADLGSRAYGGPVIAGGKIYVGTNNDKPRDKAFSGDHSVLMCFRESDGKFLWQHAYPKADEANDSPREGITSTPWVEGDRLWYVNNHGVVVCSDTDGKVVWKYDMVKELNVFVCQQVYTSPLVVGDLVYALTCNGVDAGKGTLPSPKAPSLIALNKKTGKLAWQNAMPGDKVLRGQWSNASAAPVNGKMQVVYGGGDGWVYGLDAVSGELIWKFDCNPKSAKPYKPGGSGERSFIVASPVIYENRCYVAVGQEPDDGGGVGHLWCIDMTKTPKNKDKDLSPAGDNFDPKAKVNADSGLVWHYGGKVTPKPKDDEREFVFGRTLSTVAIAGGLVYAAELEGYLHCVDARTGQKYWVHDFQSQTWCSPYYVDGKIFIGTDSNELYIFQAGKKLIPPKKVDMGQLIKVPPAAAGGVLYVNSGSTLYAIKK